MGRTKTIDDSEILNQARKAFRESGHAASTREIARAAGISQAVIYQRFGSKEDLFCLAMTPERPDLESLLGPYPPRSARADLKRIGERLAGYLRALQPTLLHVLAHPDLGHARLAKWHANLPFHALVSALTERFQRLADDGLVGKVDPGAAAQTFLAAVHSATILETMAHGAAHGGRAGQVSPLIEVLWNGIAPRRSRRE